MSVALVDFLTKAAGISESEARRQIVLGNVTVRDAVSDDPAARLSHPTTVRYSGEVYSYNPPANLPAPADDDAAVTVTVTMSVAEIQELLSATADRLRQFEQLVANNQTDEYSLKRLEVITATARKLDRAARMALVCEF